MRPQIACFLLVGLIGCKHFGSDACAVRHSERCESACTESCVEPCSNPKPCRTETVVERSAPCAAPCAAKSCAPEVEVRAAAPVHVKLPPQKIVVENAPQAQVQQVQPQLAYAQTAMMAPQAQVQSVPVMAMAESGSDFEHTLASSARPGLTFDFIRLPIPIPKLVAVPTAPRMRAFSMSMPQAVPVQSVPMQSVPMQSVPVQTMPVQSMAATQMVQPVQAMQMPVAQAQTMVPIQGQAVVPVQGQAIVPVQGQALVPVQSQAMVPTQAAQQIMIQPQAQIVPTQAATQAAPAQAQGQLTANDLDTICRWWQQQKEAAGRK